MLLSPWRAGLAVLLCGSLLLAADEFELEPGFTLLFNGKNLDGWKLRGGEALTGKTATDKNRFQVIEGRLVIDGKSRGNMVIDSEHEFAGDTHIKFDFLPDEKCNNDLYFRGLKFDLKPASVKNFAAGKWHQFEIVAAGDQVQFISNGEVQATQKPRAERSPLGIRAEFGAVEIRRLRYK